MQQLLQCSDQNSAASHRQDPVGALSILRVDGDDRRTDTTRDVVPNNTSLLVLQLYDRLLLIERVLPWIDRLFATERRGPPGLPETPASLALPTRRAMDAFVMRSSSAGPSRPSSCSADASTSKKRLPASSSIPSFFAANKAAAAGCGEDGSDRKGKGRERTVTPGVPCEISARRASSVVPAAHSGQVGRPVAVLQAQGRSTRCPPGPDAAGRD